MKTSRTVSIFACMLLSAAGMAAEVQQDAAITIYNDNFAVVKERREMTFEKGSNRVQFTGVAEQIDPTSVNFCVSRRRRPCRFWSRTMNTT